MEQKNVLQNFMGNQDLLAHLYFETVFAESVPTRHWWNLTKNYLLFMPLVLFDILQLKCIPDSKIRFEI